MRIESILARLAPEPDTRAAFAAAPHAAVAIFAFPMGRNRLIGGLRADGRGNGGAAGGGVSFSSEAKKKTTTTTAAWRFIPRTTPACVVCVAAGDGRGRNPTPVSAPAVHIPSPLVLGADLLRVPNPSQAPTSSALPARAPIYESVIRARYALLVPRPLPLTHLFLYPLHLSPLHACTFAHLIPVCSAVCLPPHYPSLPPFASPGIAALARSLSYLNYRSIALRFAAAAAD